MPRYRLDIAFHGAEFHGWQRQPDQRTVQGELEMCLGRVLRHGEPLPITGAGRTDTGVHARGMVAHFDRPTEIETDELRARLAVALPHDIVVRKIMAVADTFHARFCAATRTYHYRTTQTRSPFDRDRNWFVHSVLDTSLLTECAGAILGTHDFSGFCKAVSQKEDNRCQVDLSMWSFAESGLTYQVRANRFLHEMVRLLVGTMVAVASGRLPRDQIQKILVSGDVRLCGDAAPPHGLTLEMITYPSD